MSGAKTRALALLSCAVVWSAPLFPARAGSEALSEIFPKWTAQADLPIEVLLIGGPWAVALAILLLRLSDTARYIGMLYAVGTALLLLRIDGDPFWPCVIGPSAVLLVVGRRRFGGLFRSIGHVCRTVWRAL